MLRRYLWSGYAFVAFTVSLLFKQICTGLALYKSATFVQKYAATESDSQSIWNACKFDSTHAWDALPHLKISCSFLLLLP